MEKTLVIGSCTVDIVIPTPRLPSTTDSINSGVHHYALGGCAYNVSQMLRLLSVPYLHAFTIGSGIYGDYVKEYNDTADIARMFLADFFKEINSFDYLEEITTINEEFAEQILKEIFDDKKMIISVIKKA